jgi:hypothetical protein
MPGLMFLEGKYHHRITYSPGVIKATNHYDKIIVTVFLAWSRKTQPLINGLDYIFYDSGCFLRIDSIICTDLLSG